MFFPGDGGEGGFSSFSPFRQITGSHVQIVRAADNVMPSFMPCVELPYRAETPTSRTRSVCQPWFYLRLLARSQAYSFFGLSEGA